MTSVLHSVLVGILLVASLWADRSEACSAAFNVQLSGIAPANGAVNVPTNAKIFLNFEGLVTGDDSVLREVILRPVGGAPLVTTVEQYVHAGDSTERQVIVSPFERLLPVAKYEVLSRVRPNCPGCIAETPELVSTFTTSGGADEVRPSFSGATGVSVGELSRCDDSACCGPYVGATFTLQHGEADDPNLIGYRIYKDGVGGRPVAMMEGPGMILCSGQDPSGSGAAFFTGPGTFFVRAVDLSGNEDTNTAGIPVSVDCTKTPNAAPGAGEGCKGCSSLPGPFIGAALLVLWGARRTRFTAGRIRASRRNGVP